MIYKVGIPPTGTIITFEDRCGSCLSPAQTFCFHHYDEISKFSSSTRWCVRVCVRACVAMKCNAAASCCCRMTAKPCHNFPPASPQDQTKETMKSATSAIFLLALVGVSLSSAFVPVSNQPTRCHVAFLANDDAETDSSSDVAGEAAAAADEEPPKPAVKCPDCDLCDGSGR